MMRLEKFLKISLQDVLKVYWRRFSRHLEDVLKMFWRRLEDGKRLEDVWRRPLYWSWSRHLEEVFWRRRRKTSSRHLQDVFINTNVCWGKLWKVLRKIWESCTFLIIFWPSLCRWLYWIKTNSMLINPHNFYSWIVYHFSWPWWSKSSTECWLANGCQDGNRLVFREIILNASPLAT